MITSAPTSARTVHRAARVPLSVTNLIVAALGAFAVRIAATWAAFATSGQLGPVSEREIGRRTGGRI